MINIVSKLCAPFCSPCYHVPTAPINDNLAEPFYIEPISRRGNSELYETIQVAQMYEVPSTSLSPERKETDIQNEHTYHVLDTAMTQERGSEDDNDTDTYHTLEPPVWRQTQANQRGHEYQELEGPTDLTDTETGQHHFSSHDRLYHTLEVNIYTLVHKLCFSFNYIYGSLVEGLKTMSCMFPIW